MNVLELSHLMAQRENVNHLRKHVSQFGEAVDFHEMITVENYVETMKEIDLVENENLEKWDLQETK